MKMSENLYKQNPGLFQAAAVGKPYKKFKAYLHNLYQRGKFKPYEIISEETMKDLYDLAKYQREI